MNCNIFLESDTVLHITISTSIHYTILFQRVNFFFKIYRFRCWTYPCCFGLAWTFCGILFWLQHENKQQKYIFHSPTKSHTAHDQMLHQILCHSFRSHSHHYSKQLWKKLSLWLIHIIRLNILLLIWICKSLWLKPISFQNH